MNSNSTTSNFLYSFNYDYHNSDLCKLEARQIFQLEEKDKVLFSDKKVDPSISPFLRHRIEIITSSPDYRELIDQIKEQGIKKEGFKVEYILFEGDESDFDERRLKMRDVGYNITGVPDFEKPTLTYAICKHDNRWYFGVLAKHDIAWHEHKKKPNSFSNSIGMDIAKALITIASKGDNTNKLLDACCGVGTVLLEGRISGFNINGNDINPKRRKQSAGNLAHYNYDGEVFCSDIADLGGKYDAVIIDLPYNLYSLTDESTSAHIISSSAKLSNRIIIVSTSNITSEIENAGLTVTDYCTVEKRGKSKFERKIWVCLK